MTARRTPTLHPREQLSQAFRLLGVMHVERLEHLKRVRAKPHDTCVAAIASLRGGTPRDQLDIGVEVGKAALRVPAIHSLQHRSHRFDVLERHRLLVQTDGFEGLRMVEIGPHSGDLPANEIPDDALWSIHHCAAASPTPLQPTEHQHTVA